MEGHNSKGGGGGGGGGGANLKGGVSEASSYQETTRHLAELRDTTLLQRTIKQQFKKVSVGNK